MARSRDLLTPKQQTPAPANAPKLLIVTRGRKLTFSRDNFGDLRIQAESIKR